MPIAKPNNAKMKITDQYTYQYQSKNNKWTFYWLQHHIKKTIHHNQSMVFISEVLKPFKIKK